MATGIVQEAYQQLRSDVQNLLTLQQSRNAHNFASAGRAQDNSDHPGSSNKSSRRSGDSTIVSRARNQISQQLGVLKRSILSVRLSNSGGTTSNSGTAVISKNILHTTSSVTSGSPSSLGALGQLKNSFKRGRDRKGGCHKDGGSTLHNNMEGGAAGAGFPKGQMLPRSSTIPSTGSCVDSIRQRISLAPHTRSDLSGPSDSNFGPLHRPHHSVVTVFGPPRLSLVNRQSGQQVDGSFFESASRLSMGPPIPVTMGRGNAGSGKNEGVPIGDVGEGVFSDDHRNTVSQWWGGNSSSKGFSGVGDVGALGVERKKSVIHHVDHATAQAAMKMRRGYGGFGGGAVPATTTATPISPTSATMEGNREMLQTYPLSSAASKLSSQKQKKKLKGIEALKDKLVKRPSGVSPLLRDASSDPLPFGARIRGGEGSSATPPAAVPAGAGSIGGASMVVSEALPIATLEASLAVLKECHEHASRFLHLGLCKDAKVLFLDSLSEEVSVLTRIAAAVVPSLDEASRINGHIPLVGGTRVITAEVGKNEGRMEESDCNRKNVGNKSGGVRHGGNQNKKKSVLSEEELPIALQAHHRVVQHEILTCVASFYTILNKDPFLDTMAETVMTAARQVEMIVDVMFRVLSTPSLLAGNGPAVWKNCKMSALQPQLFDPGVASAGVATSPGSAWSPGPSHRIEGMAHGNLLVAQYLLSDLLAVREAGVPGTSFPDGSLRQEKRYSVAETGYHMIFNGTVYVYEMSLYLLRRVQNCLSDANRGGGVQGDIAALYGDGTENLGKPETLVGGSHGGNHGGSMRTYHPAAATAAALLPDVYRLCIRHIGACIEISEPGRFRSLLKLATVKYLPWRLKMFDAVTQCMESMAMYTEALQVAQQAAHSVRFLLELECSDPVPPPPAFMKVLEHAAEHTMLQMMRYGWYDLIATAWRQRGAGVTGGENTGSLSNAAENANNSGAFQVTSPTGNSAINSGAFPTSSGAGPGNALGGAPVPQATALSTITTILPEHSSVSTISPLSNSTTGALPGAGVPSSSSVALGEGYGVSLTLPVPHNGRELLDSIWRVVEKTSLPFAMHQKKLDTSATAAAIAAASSSLNTGSSRGGHKKGGAGNLSTSTLHPPLSMEQAESLKAARKEEEAQYTYYMAQQFQQHALHFLISLFVYQSVEINSSSFCTSRGSSPIGGVRSSFSADTAASFENTAKVPHNSNSINSTTSPSFAGTKSGGGGSNANSSNIKDGNALALLNFSHLRQCAIEALEVLMQYMCMHYFIDPAHRQELLRGDTTLYPFQIPNISLADERLMKVATQKYLDDVQTKAIEMVALAASPGGRSRSGSTVNTGGSGRRGGGVSGQGERGAPNGGGMGSGLGKKVPGLGGGADKGTVAILQQLCAPPKERNRIAEDPDFITMVRIENYFPTISALHHLLHQRLKLVKAASSIDAGESSSIGGLGGTQVFGSARIPSNSSGLSPVNRLTIEIGTGASGTSTLPHAATSPHAASGAKKGLAQEDNQDGSGNNVNPGNHSSRGKRNCLPPISVEGSTSVSTGGSSTSSPFVALPNNIEGPSLPFLLEDELQKELLCLVQVIRYLYLTKHEALFYRCAAALDHFLRGALIGTKFAGGSPGAPERALAPLPVGNSPLPSSFRSPVQPSDPPLPSSGGYGAGKHDVAPCEVDRSERRPLPVPTTANIRQVGTRSVSPPTLSPGPENRTRDAVSRVRDAGIVNPSIWNRLVQSALCWIRLLESLRYSVLTMRFQQRTLNIEEVLLVGPYYVPPGHSLLDYFMRSGGYITEVGKLFEKKKKVEAVEAHVMYAASVGGGGGHGKGSARGGSGSVGRDGKAANPVLLMDLTDSKSYVASEGGAAGATAENNTGFHCGAFPIPFHPYPLVSPLLPASMALRSLAQVLTPGGASTRAFGEGPLLGFNTSVSVAAACVYEEVMQAVGRFLIVTGTDSIQYRRKERNARIQQGITCLPFQDPEQANTGALSVEKRRTRTSIPLGEENGVGKSPPTSPGNVTDSSSGRKENHTLSMVDSFSSNFFRCTTTPVQSNRTEDEVDEEEERAYFDVVVNSISGMITSGLTNEMSVGEFAIQLASSALEDLGITEKQKRSEREEEKRSSSGNSSGRLDHGSCPLHSGEQNGCSGEGTGIGICSGQVLNKTLLRPYAEVGNVDMVGPYLTRIEEMEKGGGGDMRRDVPLFPNTALLRLNRAINGSNRKQKEVQTIKLLERSRLALSFVKTALSMVTTRHKHFTASGIYQGKRRAGERGDAYPHVIQSLGMDAARTRDESDFLEGSRKGKQACGVMKNEEKKVMQNSCSLGDELERTEEGDPEQDFSHLGSPYRSRPSVVLSTFREHAASQRFQEEQAVFLGNALRDCRTYLTRFVVELRYNVACLRAQVAVYTKHHEDIIQLLERHRNTKVFGAVTAKDARILETLLSEDPELPETTEEEEAKLLNWSAQEPALHALVLLCLANVLPSPRHRRARLDAAMEALRSISQLHHHHPRPTDPYSLIIIWGFAASTSSTLRAMSHSNEAKKVLYHHYLFSSSSCSSVVTAPYSGRMTGLSLAEVFMKNHLNTNEKAIETSSELALLNFSGALMDLAAAEMETSRRKKGRIEKENPAEPHAVALGVMSDWEWNRQHQITGLFCASNALLALRLLERISSCVAAAKLIFPCVNLMFNCLLPCLGDQHFNAVILLPIVSMTYALLDFEGEGWGEAGVQMLAFRILHALKTHLSLGGVAGRGLTLQEQGTQCALTQLLYTTFAHVWNRVLEYPNTRQRRYFQHVLLHGLRARYVYAQSLSAIQPEEDPEGATPASEPSIGGPPKSRGSSKGHEKGGGRARKGSSGRSARSPKESAEQAAAAAGPERKAEGAGIPPESLVFPGSHFVPSPLQPHLYDQVPVEYLELMEELLFHDPVMGCSILPVGGSGSSIGSTSSAAGRRTVPAEGATGIGGGNSGTGGRAPLAGATGSHAASSGGNMSPLRGSPSTARRSKQFVDELEWRVHLDKLLRPQALAGIPLIIVDTVSTLANCLSSASFTSSMGSSGSSNANNNANNTSSSGAGGVGASSAGGGGVHMAQIADVLGKHTGDLLYTKVVHRTMECLFRLEEFSTAKMIGLAALETMKTLELQLRQWLLRLHRGFFSWLALNGYIFADSRRIQEEKEAEERRKTLESKRIKEGGRAGRKVGPPAKGNKNKKKAVDVGGTTAKSTSQKGNKRNGVSGRSDLEDDEGNSEEDSLQFLDIAREWNSAEKQMLRQTTRALGWIRRRRADRFIFRRVTAFNRLVSSQIRLYLAAIIKLETMETEHKKKYHEERWQYYQAKLLFGGGTAPPMIGLSHFQDGKLGGNASERGITFSGPSSGQSRGVVPSGGGKKGRNSLLLSSSDGSKEDTLSVNVVFTKHCANAAAILNNAFLSSQAMRAVSMAVDELRNGALADVPDAYLLATREDRRLSNSISFSPNNIYKVHEEEGRNSASLNGSNTTRGTLNNPSSPLGAFSPTALPSHSSTGSHPPNIAKEGSFPDGDKIGLMSPTSDTPSAMPHIATDLTQCVDEETMRRLTELSPLLIRLATELLFSLTSIQRGYCDHRRDIEAIQPTGTKTGLFCCLAEQVHFQGFVPSLYAILSPAGQFEEQRISRLAPNEHAKVKRIQRRRLDECISAENVSREACMNAYRSNLISVLNQFSLVLPNLQKHRENLIQEVQDDSSDDLGHAVPDDLLILHSQAHRNGDMYCTMDAHEAHATLRRAAMNCPALVHFPFEAPEGMKFTTEERIRQLQLGHDLPEEVIMEMILFLVSGMQFTAQREALDMCNIANELTNHRFASILLPIAIHIGDTIGTHTAGLYNALESVKKGVPIGKAALTAARLNWRWYKCTQQYQRALKRFTRLLFPSFLSSKRKDVGEDPSGILLPSGDSDGRGMAQIENRTLNRTNYANFSSQGTCGAALLGSLSSVNLKTVLASYHRAASRLREFRDFGALSECLLELGQVYLLHRNKAEAEATWLEALDAAVEIPRVLFNWRTTVCLPEPRSSMNPRLKLSSPSSGGGCNAETNCSPNTAGSSTAGSGSSFGGISASLSSQAAASPSQGLSPQVAQGTSSSNLFFSSTTESNPHGLSFSIESIGLTRLFMALISLSSLAMYAYREDQGKAIDCYLLAASLVWGFYHRGASVNFPERLYDFVDFSMNDIVVTMYLEESVRKKMPNIVHHLLFISHELQQFRYYNFAGMMGSLSEYMAMRYLQDAKLVVEARLIRAKAAAGGGNFGAAMGLLRSICQGAQLPSSLLSVLPIPSRCSVVDCCSSSALSATGISDKKGVKGGGASAVAFTMGNYAAGGGSGAGGDGSTATSLSGAVMPNNLVGVLGTGGRAVGKDIERRLYNDQELPTSPANLQSICTFVTDCFPHVHMDLQSGPAFIHGGGGTASSNSSAGGGGSGGSASSSSAFSGGGANSASTVPNFLHNEVSERYGMLLSRRVILAVAEVLITLGGREAAYLWPYDMSRVTGVVLNTYGASGFMGGAGGMGVGMTVSAGSSAGIGGSGGGGGVAGTGMGSSSSSAGGGGPAEGSNTTRRPAGREGRGHRNSFGSGSTLFGGVGSGAGGSGSTGSGMGAGGGGGPWVPQRTACTEALKAGEFLLEPFLQKEFINLTSAANPLSGGSATKKGTGVGGGVGGNKWNSTGKQGHGGGRAGQGAGGTGGGFAMTWPSGAGGTDMEQDALFQSYQKRLEEAGCLRHHAILLKALAIGERGHSRVAIALLEEEIQEYNRAMDSDEPDAGNESGDSFGNGAERRGSGASSTGGEEIHGSRSLKSHRPSDLASTFPQGMSLSGSTAQSLSIAAQNTKKKRSTHTTQLGLGFNIEKVSNIPSFILSLSHTHWCRVWYGLTVNYFRLRAFQKMEKAAQQGILLCERCNDPYSARIFSLYRATALAQRGFLREAIETVTALKEVTTNLSVGYTDPYEAWSMMSLEWLKRMALVQEGGTGGSATVGGGGSGADSPSEEIWVLVMPLLQHYAEFCGLLPWEMVESDENPNSFSWKVRKTSTSSVSLCRALVSVKLHTVMNAEAESKLKRYLGRRPPEDSFSGPSCMVGGGVHRNQIPSIAGRPNGHGSGHSKMKSTTASGMGSGPLTVLKTAGALPLGVSSKPYNATRCGPLGSPQLSKNGGGCGEGGGVACHAPGFSWQMDLIPAINLLEQAIQGLSSQYDTSAYPSLLIESKLLLAQALLLTHNSGREIPGRIPPLAHPSLGLALHERGGTSGTMLSSDGRYRINFGPSEDLTRDSYNMSINSTMNLKEVVGERAGGGGYFRGQEQQRMISSLPVSTGKQRRQGGGSGAAGTLGGYLSNTEDTGHKTGITGAGGGGILTSQRAGLPVSGMSSRRHSSAATAVEVADNTLSAYIPDSRIQRICKLLLETAESTASSGTHDFRVLRRALLELATLLSRYECTSPFIYPLEDEKEGSASEIASDNSHRRGRGSSGNTTGPLSGVAASCIILSHLVQEMMNHVNSGANAFHIYSTDESTITDSLSLQERFPDFVMAGIHSAVSGVGQLAEISCAESSTAEQQQRLLLHPPMIMTVSPFYSDLLANSGMEGGGSSKRREGTSNNGTVAFNASNSGSARGGGGHSLSQGLMMNDANGVLAAGAGIAGNPASVFLHSPMPVTVQDIAHTFATLQRERGMYVVAPPLEALNHETALLQLKSYLQEKTTSPTCTYLCYSNEIRRQCAKQLLPSKGGAGGIGEGGSGATGGAGSGTSVSARGGNKREHTSVTQQQQLDNAELWHALVPPVLLKTLPTFFFTPTGPDRLGASKINTVVAQSFISASYDARRQGCDQVPGMEEAGMVTLLLSISPYYDPSITQPPPIASAADRKRLLVANMGDLNNNRIFSASSSAPSERIGSSSSSTRMGTSGGAGPSNQFKNRLAATPAQIEPRTVHVDGPLQDRLQELAVMDSSAAPGAHLGIYGPGYDPENENSKKGLWTCVSFELPKKVVEELHRQALEVLRWYALEESDQRKHPESAAAAAAILGAAAGDIGREITVPSLLAESGTAGILSNSHSNPLNNVSASGGHYSGRNQNSSNVGSSTPSTGYSHPSQGSNVPLPYGTTGGGATGGFSVPGSANASTGPVGSTMVLNSCGGPTAAFWSTAASTTSSVGVGLSPAFSSLYSVLQQSLVALQHKCHQQQMAHTMGGGGTSKRGVNSSGTGGGGGGAGSGGSIGSGAISAPKGVLGDTSAPFLAGLMAGANGYLSGGSGVGNLAAGTIHVNAGGAGMSSSSNNGGVAGANSVSFTLPPSAGSASTGSASGPGGTMVNPSLPSSNFHISGGGNSILGFSGGGIEGGCSHYSPVFSCDFTERHYYQQQAAREEESRRIVKHLDECKSLLLMNWIESIVKNYVARSMADEALMESCIHQLLPTCAFSKEVVEFLAHWLTNDGGAAKFFHPGVYSWMRKITNFIVKMRRSTASL